MCENKNFKYDNLSEVILDRLLHFTEIVQTLTNISYELMQNCSVVDDPDFIDYTEYLRTGQYYHYRSQGFMEELVISKNYSSQSLCYWYEELVSPAFENIMNAFSIIDVYPLLYQDLVELREEFGNLLDTIDEIKELVNKFDLCF